MPFASECQRCGRDFNSQTAYEPYCPACLAESVWRDKQSNKDLIISSESLMSKPNPRLEYDRWDRLFHMHDVKEEDVKAAAEYTLKPTKCTICGEIAISVIEDDRIPVCKKCFDKLFDTILDEMFIRIKLLGCERRLRETFDRMREGIWHEGIKEIGEKSTALWDVYKMNEPCSCCGKFLLEYLKDREKNNDE